MSAAGNAPGNDAQGAGLRIDKLLFFLRLAKTRGLAQQWAERGHIRRNGRRVGRSSATVAPGDVLTIPLGSRAVAIEVLSLPARRGPASEAQGFYRRLDETLDAPGASPLAANDSDRA